jgi:hypothetical protein
MSGAALPPVSRRTALLTGSGSLAVTLSACRTGATAGPAPTADPTADPSGASAPAAEGDLELLRRALDRERQLRRDALRTARRHGGLRANLRRTAEVHTAHTDLLQRSVEGSSAGPVPRRVAGDPRAAARALAGDERALADAHARAALDARSGPFARVLAGMAAAADQQAVLLDSLAVPGRRGG